MTNTKQTEQRRTVWALLILFGVMTPLSYVCQWLIFRPNWSDFALSVLIGTCMTLVGAFAALLVSPYGAEDEKRLTKVSTTIITLVTGYALAKIIDPLVAQIIGSATAPSPLTVRKGTNLLIGLMGFLGGFLGTYVFRAYLGTSLFRDELPEIGTEDPIAVAPPSEEGGMSRTKTEGSKVE